MNDIITGRCKALESIKRLNLYSYRGSGIVVNFKELDGRTIFNTTLGFNNDVEITCTQRILEDVERILKSNLEENKLLLETELENVNKALGEEG